MYLKKIKQHRVGQVMGLIPASQKTWRPMECRERGNWIMYVSILWGPGGGYLWINSMNKD